MVDSTHGKSGIGSSDHNSDRIVAGEAPDYVVPVKVRLLSDTEARPVKGTRGVLISASQPYLSSMPISPRHTINLIPSEYAEDFMDYISRYRFYDPPAKHLPVLLPLPCGDRLPWYAIHICDPSPVHKMQIHLINKPGDQTLCGLEYHFNQKLPFSDVLIGINNDEQCVKCFSLAMFMWMVKSDHEKP